MSLTSVAVRGRPDRGCGRAALRRGEHPGGSDGNAENLEL